MRPADVALAREVPDLYFNEIDPHAAEWLGNLWPGASIDTRSIADVAGSDVAHVRRVHWFAGVGGWEYALRLAGWPAARPIWSGSCPCQPFSEAGKRKGTADDRHLWPEFLRLIAECRPATVVGEQVASNLGREWLARVRLDLEALGYAVGAADLCAPGTGEDAEGWLVRGDTSDAGRWERIVLGAPHIRQRLYWGAVRRDRGVADPGRQRGGEIWSEPGSDQSPPDIHHQRCCSDGRVGDDGLGDPRQSRLAGRPGQPGDDGSQLPAAERAGGATGSPWSSFDLIPCRDGRARRVESGTFPLVDGLPTRMGRGQSGVAGVDRRAGRSRRRVAARNRTIRLRGYGNAIVPQLAAVFIRAFMDSITDLTGPSRS
jgi:DNA (cytosine-5)-methyltransferase 1